MSRSEHGESSEGNESSTAPFDWELLMRKNTEALEKAGEIYRKSLEAGVDVTRITRKHLDKMMEDFEDPQYIEDAKPREIYRKMAQCCSEMIKEILGTPSVLHLYAENIDAFLDWKVTIQDVQEQYLKSMGFVTQSELSEIHKTVHELKKEVEKICRSIEREGGLSHGNKKR